MRESMGKYRGKRDNGEWVYGGYVTNASQFPHMFLAEVGIQPDHCYAFAVDPATVGICIGNYRLTPKELEEIVLNYLNNPEEGA